MGWIVKLLGVVISAFAARQGTPFCFNQLKKFVKLRGATQPKKEEAKG